MMRKAIEIFITCLVSYIITFALDSLLLMDRREVFISNPELMIFRPGSNIELLLYYFFIAVILTLIFWGVRHRNRSEKNNYIKWGVRVISFLGFIIFLIISLFYLMPEPKVSSITEISGYVHKNNSYSYLLIRPVADDQYWLQRPIPLVLDQNGGWRTNAFFGGRSGERFEIVLVNSAVPLHPNILSSAGSYDFEEIPKEAILFIRVVEKG